MADEQVIIPCAGCGVPILSWWAPDGGGLLRGEYVLIGDTLWHHNCWDKEYARYEQERAVDQPTAEELGRTTLNPFENIN